MNRTERDRQTMSRPETDDATRFELRCPDPRGGGDLLCRPFQPGDLPGVLRLFAEGTDWGSVSEQQWRAWSATPHGEALVLVAVDRTGEVMAHQTYYPSRVVIGGQSFKALRLAMPVVDPRLGSASLRRAEHPVWRLRALAREVALARGEAVIYALPHTSWRGIRRLLARVDSPRSRMSPLGCRGIRPVAARALRDSATSGWTARWTTTPGDDYAALWDLARRQLPIDCAVERSPGWLAYKHEGLIEVRQGSDLVGYGAVRDDGLMTDLLARRADELEGVLVAVLGWLLDRRGAEVAAEGREHLLKAMATPLLTPLFDRLGFDTVDYQFLFLCTPLVDEVTDEMVAIDRWFLTHAE